MQVTRPRNPSSIESHYQYGPIKRDYSRSAGEIAVSLKLTTELVPSTSWYSNMRKFISQLDWDVLRKSVYAQYEHKCGICSAEGKLNCHEIWQYDDNTHVQQLSGFIALCDWCHHVKHLGFAGILAKKGKLDYEKVRWHFMTVNNCDKDVFDQHVNAAFAQWQARSEHEWKIDLGAYGNIVI